MHNVRFSLTLRKISALGFYSNTPWKRDRDTSKEVCNDCCESLVLKISFSSQGPSSDNPSPFLPKTPGFILQFHHKCRWANQSNKTLPWDVARDTGRSSVRSGCVSPYEEAMCGPHAAAETHQMQTTATKRKRLNYRHTAKTNNIDQVTILKIGCECLDSPGYILYLCLLTRQFPVVLWNWVTP